MFLRESTHVLPVGDRRHGPLSFDPCSYYDEGILVTRGDPAFGERMRGLIIRNARQRKWIVRVGLLLVLGVALFVGHPWRSSPKGTSARKGCRLKPVSLTVAPGIHLLGRLFPAAAYVVETTDGLVLIDTGAESDAHVLKEELAELKLDGKRLRAILLTHVHADHTGGAEHLRAATGAKVYAGQGDARYLRAGKSHEAFFSTFQVPNAALHATTVDVELKGDEEITIGGVRFRALAAPGHTPGSICYLMEREGLRVLFSGDVIMSLVGRPQSVDRLSRPLGTYAAYLPPRYRGDAQSFLTTLRQLRALPAPDLILPGHPRMDPTPQDPAMSQERWEALLDAGITDMETLRARYRRDGELFLDGTPRRLVPDLYYLGDFKGFAVYGFVAGSRLFLVDAPGGAGLLDFCQTRLRGLGVKPATPTAVLLTSCDAEATAGLSDLVANRSIEVVVGAAGLQLVKNRCPEGTVVLAAEDLARKGWFEVEALALSGYGRAPVAYQVHWSGKTVLFTGRIPLPPAETTMHLLAAEFVAGRADRAAYAASLRQLANRKPDLWLPLAPANGQNANLYDREWEVIIMSNNWAVYK
jgi:glyoxylase-like metal-dependent hydrolase (beta-lactamase superfamily II)